MIDVKRRVFLKGSAAAGAVVAAAGAGLIAPQAVLAEWNEAAFRSKTVADAVMAQTGTDASEESADINIKAPEIAENGAVVPVSVSSSIAGVTAISILAASNPSPMVASFALGEGTVADVSTRIKMGKTGDVIAVVQAGDKVYTAKKEVKVTIGGCGG